MAYINLSECVLCTNSVLEYGHSCVFKYEGHSCVLEYEGHSCVLEYEGHSYR